MHFPRDRVRGEAREDGRYRAKKTAAALVILQKPFLEPEGTMELTSWEPITPFIPAQEIVTNK